MMLFMQIFSFREESERTNILRQILVMTLNIPIGGANKLWCDGSMKVFIQHMDYVRLSELIVVSHKETAICYNGEKDCIAKLQTTKLPKWLPVWVSARTSQTFIHSVLSHVWITSQFSATFVCLWNVDKIAEKVCLSHRLLPVFQTFYQEPLPDHVRFILAHL